MSSGQMGGTRGSSSMATSQTTNMESGMSAMGISQNSGTGMTGTSGQPGTHTSGTHHHHHHTSGVTGTGTGMNGVSATGMNGTGHTGDPPPPPPGRQVVWTGHGTLSGMISIFGPVIRPLAKYHTHLYNSGANAGTLGTFQSRIGKRGNKQDASFFLIQQQKETPLHLMLQKVHAMAAGVMQMHQAATATGDQSGVPAWSITDLQHEQLPCQNQAFSASVRSAMDVMPCLT